MKICTKCKVEKEDKEFALKKNKSGSYSVRSTCKPCLNESSKERFKIEAGSARDSRLLKQKEWKASNRDKVNVLNAKYRTKVKIIRLSSIQHEAHVISYLRYIKKISTTMYDRHVIEWASNGTIKARWMQSNDMCYVVFNRLKRGVQRCFNNKDVSTGGWFFLLGYTTQDLKRHIEKQFTYGMDWDNRREWHIDHIKPLCMYDMKSIHDAEFKECFALDNLRPLWAHQNRSKYHCYDKLLIPK